MDARTSKRQRKLSTKQERRMAEDLGGRVMPASGALANAKSDVRAMGKVRAEAKYTSKESYSLKFEDLIKIVGEAGLEKAVLQLCFLDRSNRPLYSFAIFPENPNGPTKSIDAGKSVKLDRDRLALWVMSKLPVFAEFNDGKKTGRYRITFWDDFVSSMEAKNA